MISVSNTCWMLNNLAAKQLLASWAIKLFRERLSYRSAKAYATTPKGFISNGCLPLLDQSSRCFSPKEGESMNIRTHAISLYRVTKTRSSMKSNKKITITHSYSVLLRTLLLFCRNTFLETTVYSCMYALLTNRGVEMAGHLFFAFLWTEMRSIITQKKNEANIQPSCPNKLGQ